MHFFQLEVSKWKGALDFFDFDTSDKNRDYRTNWIEQIRVEPHPSTCI